MSGENTLEAKKGIVVKIIIPILLVCIIGGIWIIKNNKKDTASVDSDNPDFSLHVTEKIQLDKLKSYGLPIIIDFGADSCIPCKEMAPVLKELNTELQGKAIIKFVDVWKYQELALGYPISVIPTQIFIDANGNPYKPKGPESKQFKLYSTKDKGEHVFTAHEGGMTKDQLLSALKEMGMK
ncbi:MAG: thioredoxin family protein [Clostridiaceae bacterium]|nr:thioredoxin family protein [Clostridiaceae bacterium]